jgi:hypothetical protein
MSLPEVSESPWGFVQWIATGLLTFAASAAAFIWRLMARLDRMSLAIAQQQINCETDKRATEDSFLRLAEMLARLNDDHYRLRETIGSLPNRGDLRDLDAHIGERIEALAARFDRALEKRTL